MNGEKLTPITNKPSLWALSPLLVFLCLYLVTSIIVNDFYKVPITIAFMVSSVYAVCITKGLSLNERMLQYSIGAANKNIMLMIWIFILAGAFAQSAKDIGAIDATVNLTLLLLPDNLLLAGIFLAACFISLSIGTSVGTIVALAPIAVGVSNATSFAMPLCLSAVVSGAMFGDNLSMISDTTIAAVRTQGCEMSDKFKMNFKIVLPAAILTAVIYFLLTMHGSSTLELGTYNIWKVIPYLLVLIGALMGINVFVVLIFGTIASVIAGVTTGTMPVNEIFTSIGAGVSSMYDITVISITVAAIGALVKEYGGIDAVLHFIHRNTKGKKGAQLSIAALVAGVDLATANNTIAIVMAGPIAREISQEFDIDPRRTASLLDIFASVAQGLIPYGAQMLYAAAAAGITTYAIIPYTFYPILMAISAFVFIFGFSQKEKSKKES